MISDYIMVSEMVTKQNRTGLTIEILKNVITPVVSVRFISNEVLHIFQWVFYAVLTQVIDIFGTVTNIINVICFVKQGSKDVINISLLGLAISDLGCLIPLIWTNICYNPAFNELDLPFEPIDLQYLIGAWPHVVFTRVTSWITAFITLERCLCITMPLKVKVIFTHKRVTAIIVSIFIAMIINFFPLFYVNRLAWKFSTSRNKTLIGLVFTEDREMFETVTFVISNVFAELSAVLVVVVCTVTLVVNLRIKSKWRQMSAAPGQADTASGRDQKVTKMVIVISTLFIVCFIPICLIIIGMIVEPELSIEGKYRNLFISVCSIGFNLESTNSAINIFVYYYMSSKYRAVFRQLFVKTSLTNSELPCKT